MPDYRSLFAADYVGAWDLSGKDVTLRIIRVVAAVLTSSNGHKKKKPVVFFENANKGFALNKTNAKTIATMYGNNTEAWIGQRITIYPTQTTFNEHQVDCVRVRPTVPKGRQQRLEPQPVNEEMRAKQDRAAAAARPEFDPETGEELASEDEQND